MTANAKSPRRVEVSPDVRRVVDDAFATLAQLASAAGVPSARVTAWVETAAADTPDAPLPLDQARERWGYEQHCTANGLRCWEYGWFDGRLGTAFALEHEGGALAWCVVEHSPTITDAELRAWLVQVLPASAGGTTH